MRNPPLGDMDKFYRKNIFWNPCWQENADLIPAINFCIAKQFVD